MMFSASSYSSSKPYPKRAGNQKKGNFIFKFPIPNINKYVDSFTWAYDKHVRNVSEGKLK